MLKPILEKFFNYRTQILNKEFDTVLLAKDYDGKLYRVKEYNGQVVDIRKRNNFNSMDKVKVKFFNNEIYETSTYLDDDINIGDLISIYGIVVRNSDHLELQCKCGSIRIYQKFAEAGRIDTKKFYKFGYSELSVIEPSSVYDVPLDRLQVLEQNKLWVYIGSDIKAIEDRGKKIIQEEENGIIDVSKEQTFFVKDTNNIEEEMIDYES